MGTSLIAAASFEYWAVAAAVSLRCALRQVPFDFAVISVQIASLFPILSYIFLTPRPSAASSSQLSRLGTLKAEQQASLKLTLGPLPFQTYFLRSLTITVRLRLFGFGRPLAHRFWQTSP